MPYFISQYKLNQLSKLIGIKLNINDDIYPDDPHYYEDDVGNHFDNAESEFSIENICWSITELVGNCGICVFSDLYIPIEYTNKGVGTFIVKLVEQIARKCGYTYIIATDKLRNKPMIKIFDRLNWTQTGTFINKRTKNKIGVYTKTI